ncbi:MAG: type II toxin-antitoxin system HicA family toxin [Sphingomonas sp.]|uniref:type II toxin-antitoxin system HicA family toxin n=1 Tax=Sphingomonas sp. TaxID=28214 RepID=UPI0025F623AD|nr:type II toxin-antitoxin system HicA family toxin [Sphingomonas sp.]MBY0282527.1 type II toxin-antitoxin system HicA family toxin [Sphingomonas sp.]
MSKISKLHAWIVANPRASIPFRDFERLVVAFGFSPIRQLGSHRLYARPDVRFVVNIQPRGKEAKSYQIQQFLAMCDQYGLKLDD